MGLWTILEDVYPAHPLQMHCCNIECKGNILDNEKEHARGVKAAIGW